jgi:hypothetical protein
MPPEKPPREVKLTMPDEATQQEVLRLFEQVDRLSRRADIPTIRAGAAAQPQDERSAVVEREWTRIVGRRRGKLTERPMIGQEVTATFLAEPGNLFGGLRRVSGTVGRNEAGELVIRSKDSTETLVTRDANVDRGQGRNR